jgi:exopolysaccharide production protein ExoQ
LPPLLALFLCTAFVALLLKFERRNSRQVTKAVWIPTIWMLYIASKPMAVWFPSSGATPDSSPLDRMFLILLLGAAAGILVKRKPDWHRAVRDHSWVLVIIIFMCISILWSDIPNTSFIRWVREAQAVLMAFLLLTEPFPSQAIESILRRTTYILIPYSMLLIRYFPLYGRLYSRWSGEAQWIGVTLQKNGLGRLCLIAVFYLIWSLAKTRRIHGTPFFKYQTLVNMAVLAMALWMLKGPGLSSYSATAVTALALGLIVFAGFYLMKKGNHFLGAGTLTIIVTAIIAIGIISVFSGGAMVGSFAPSLGRNSTLTDRTGVWQSLLPIAMQEPLIGHGVGGFWTAGTREEFNISEGHSGYLDILLNYGFVGIFLISAFLLSSCRKAHRELSIDFDWGVLWICYLVMDVVHNITESSLHSFTSQMTAVMLFLSFSAAHGRTRNNDKEMS